MVGDECAARNQRSITDLDALDTIDMHIIDDAHIISNSKIWRKTIFSITVYSHHAKATAKFHPPRHIYFAPPMS